jgi:uracil-DNA glycosylase
MVTRQTFEGKMHKSWLDELESVLCSSQLQSTYRLIAADKAKGIIVYPAFDICFRALQLPLQDVRVVILGQDPYHDGSATGFSFANDFKLKGKISPSLKIIFDEIERSVYGGCMLDKDPSLEPWASQGVLLLNTALTVQKGKPGSHTELWKLLTYKILNVLRENVVGVTYLLWGRHAQEYIGCIDDVRNNILTAPHPASELYSPGSGFIGCDHFVKVNRLIEESNGESFKIRW